MADLLKHVEVKANKEHKCSLCNGKIKKKEMYINQSLVDSAAPYTLKMHKHCYELVGNLDFDITESADDFAEELSVYIHEMDNSHLSLMLYNYLKGKGEIK